MRIIKQGRGVRYLLLLLVLAVAACGGELVPIKKSESQIPELKCEELDECGIGPNMETINCQGFGEECIVLSKCNQGKCVQPAHACEWECGTQECAIMQSFPAQLGCRSTLPIKSE